jgi:hypothetical protein
VQYGFKHVATPMEIVSLFPNLVPHTQDALPAENASVVSDQHSRKHLAFSDADREKPCGNFAAVMVRASVRLPLSIREDFADVRCRDLSLSIVQVFSDPRDWYRDLQVVADVLVGYVQPPHPDK